MVGFEEIKKNDQERKRKRKEKVKDFDCLGVKVQNSFYRMR